MFFFFFRLFDIKCLLLGCGKYVRPFLCSFFLGSPANTKISWFGILFYLFVLFVLLFCCLCPVTVAHNPKRDGILIQLNTRERDLSFVKCWCWWWWLCVVYACIMRNGFRTRRRLVAPYTVSLNVYFSRREEDRNENKKTRKKKKCQAK